MEVPCIIGSLPNDLVLLIYKEIHRSLVLASFKEVFGTLTWHESYQHYYHVNSNNSNFIGYDRGHAAYNFRTFDNGKWDDEFGMYQVMHHGNIIWKYIGSKVPAKY